MANTFRDLLMYVFYCNYLLKFSDYLTDDANYAQEYTKRGYPLTFKSRYDQLFSQLAKAKDEEDLLGILGNIQ